MHAHMSLAICIHLFNSSRNKKKYKKSLQFVPHHLILGAPECFLVAKHSWRSSELKAPVTVSFNICRRKLTGTLDPAKVFLSDAQRICKPFLVIIFMLSREIQSMVKLSVTHSGWVSHGTVLQYRRPANKSYLWIIYLVTDCHMD